MKLTTVSTINRTFEGRISLNAHAGVSKHYRKSCTRLKRNKSAYMLISELREVVSAWKISYHVFCLRGVGRRLTNVKLQDRSKGCFCTVVQLTSPLKSSLRTPCSFRIRPFSLIMN